jgi:hypothetical protein
MGDMDRENRKVKRGNIRVKTGNIALDGLGILVVDHARTFFNLPEDVSIVVRGKQLKHGHLAETGPTAHGFGIDMESRKAWPEVKFVEILAHELVHVKQFIFDGLVLDIEKNTTLFKGKRYRTFNDAEYYLAPWEMEARAYEYYFRWHAGNQNWLNPPLSVVQLNPNQEAA